jgi:purine-nucleoside phosphorylase
MDQLTEAATYIERQGIVAPEIGIILGTGLGNHFVHEIQHPIVVDYHDIPHFPPSTVEFHQGRLIYGTVAGRKVLAMQGRYHYYEGYSMHQITLPVRVMKLLGIRYLLISNAAGNLNRSWRKGEMMLVDDHINLQSENPLRGKNLDALGPRFPDMSEPYNRTLNQKLIQIAGQLGITLRVGVYVAVVGPNLETRAEYRFLQRIGADAVGMSTVPEVIVANHMGLPCCAVSVLTDDCDPGNLKPADINEIITVAGEAAITLTSLYVALINEI